MNLQERTLGVLSCRYVDEVIIGAPISCKLRFTPPIALLVMMMMMMMIMMMMSGYLCCVFIMK